MKRFLGHAVLWIALGMMCAGQWLLGRAIALGAEEDTLDDVRGIGA